MWCIRGVGGMRLKKIVSHTHTPKMYGPISEAFFRLCGRLMCTKVLSFPGLRELRRSH
jgi:hypothetical protein